MENSICVDTDILIDILHNEKESVQWLKENRDKNLKTTVINAFELYAGVYRVINEEEAKNSVRLLLENLPLLDFSEKNVEEAGRIHALLEKQGNIIDNRDIFIGVIAKMANCKLKTNNKKHFERIQGLKIAD
jgi:predicted nucleic acid-binding protein